MADRQKIRKSMNQQEKYKYAYKFTSIASTGLTFIEDSLASIMGTATDLAFLRSFYMLLSYNFELILKSRIVMTGNFSDKSVMNDELRKLGHDITKIGNKLGVANLSVLGIKEIAENAQYKIITADDKEIFIENFTKIRYDFLDDVMRNVDSREHERMKEYTRILTDVILRKAKEQNEEEKNKKLLTDQQKFGKI